MENDKTRTGHSGTIPVLGGLICLYFLCPFVYLSPFILIYGKHGRPPNAVVACFWPVIYLDDHVPIYRHFLEQEARLLGLY